MFTEQGELVGGSIPAWAGKPFVSSPLKRRWWVYPRVGGETNGEPTFDALRKGLSPRGRGNQLHVG